MSQHNMQAHGMVQPQQMPQQMPPQQMVDAYGRPIQQHQPGSPPMQPQQNPHHQQQQQQQPHQGFRRVQSNRNRTVSVDNLSILEAAKRVMGSLHSKTPVSVLQELLVSRGTVPKYELVQIEGLIHEPIFRYRVTVADVVAIGTGRSKKQAKHKAAKTLLDKLAGEVQAADAAAASANGGDAGASSDNGDASYESNPIGWLQEMCMKRFMPPPRYVTEQEDGAAGNGNGAPHERVFTVACLLKNFRELGRGKSKKVAKRQAAHNMWQFLQDMKQEPAEATDEEQKGGNAATRYADMKSSKISTLTTSHSQKVAQFHKHLKQTSGTVLAKLQVTPLNTKDFSYVKFLQDIATEQNFEVTYVEIEEKSISKKCQCLVQLSTLPVAVCYGSGNNNKEAQSAAAQNALEYLKIMTKK